MPRCWYNVKNCFLSKCCGRQGAVGGPVTAMVNVVKGSKYAWTDRAQLVRMQTYMPLWMLIDFVEKTRTKRFYDESDREEIRLLLAFLRKQAPFTENKRYPEEYWVNLSVGPVSDAIDLLQRSFDLPEIEEHQPDQQPYQQFQPEAMLQQPPPTQPKQQQRRVPQQSRQDQLKVCKQMYDTAMADLRRYAYLTEPHQLAKAGIYNRSTFEERFSIHWTEKVAQKTR